jgi:transposase
VLSDIRERYGGRAEPVIGFLDETSLRTDPSRRRVINTPIIRYTDKGQRYAARSMSIFGFMSLNGKDVIMASESAKSVDMASFLEVMSSANEEGRPILVVLDNATIHRAKLTRALAEDLGIFLAFLPPYSPDLQPIEFGWKDLKRELAAKLNFDAMIDASGPTALRLFKERKAGYSAHWAESFICSEG